jgi:hypothetical protein
MKTKERTTMAIKSPSRKSASKPHAASGRRSLLPSLAPHRLVLAPRSQGGDLELVAATGGRTIRILIRADGVDLQVDGLGMRWSPDGGLRVEAERVSLVGRREVSIETAGDLAVRAGGRVSLTGSDQVISAGIGNVDIHANDDVRVSGERVLLNS